MSTDETIQRLNERVTVAIFRAKRLEEERDTGTQAAYADVAEAEEALAGLHSADTVDGAVSRVGAVRARVKAGQRDRAEALAATYLADPKLHAGRHEEIRDLLRVSQEVPTRDPSEALCHALLTGALIRALRERSRLSQDHLSTALGVAQTTVSRFERGSEEPTPKALDTMARSLGLDPAEMRSLIERCWSRMAATARGLLRLAADAPWHDPVLDASGPDGATGAARFAVEVVLIEEGRGPARDRRPRAEKEG